MAKYFDEPDFDDLINIASFLDPRVKTKHLNDQNVIKQRIVEESAELIKSGAVDVDNHPFVLISSDEPSTSYGPPNKLRKLSSLLKEATSTILCGTSRAPEGEQARREMKLKSTLSYLPSILK